MGRERERRGGGRGGGGGGVGGRGGGGREGGGRRDALTTWFRHNVMHASWCNHDQDQLVTKQYSVHHMPKRTNLRVRSSILAIPVINF